MIYDLTVTITIRRKDEYRDSLEVREQGVVFLDSFPEIAAVVQRFHELLEDVAGPSPAESAPRRPRRTSQNPTPSRVQKTQAFRLWKRRPKSGRQNDMNMGLDAAHRDVGRFGSG